MTPELERSREIFLHAVGRLPADQWDAYVDEACAGDAELAARVRHLLRAHTEAGSFLEGPAAGLAATATYPPVEQAAGAAVGPYKLLQKLGEGGMGEVWMAEQTAPVQRKVALKLIRPGMDTKQVVARFEAERQALALMDHPNIARVFDGGATPAGRPFFVMELVKGVPVTRYCDEHRLPPKERLGLFAQACQAVQHAHQKGVIHRDLKPSNVLVAPYDGRPVVKVIDFGVAKAAGPRLTEKTLFTEFGAVIGTPEYMSPEQAELNNQDIDTRSDVYSLGVLLYELLTGSPPFTKKDLEKAGMLEMLRVIREQEPSKPSTKLSTADGLPTLAANRGTEPAKLTKLIRGELDWIVMKALEKNRSRRYETANSFAMDIQRYLADEPVEACPPTAGYRMRKFARKYRKPLRVAAAFLFLLVMGAITSTWLAIWATVAEKVAKQREQEAVEAKGKVQSQRDELALINENIFRAKYLADMKLAQGAWQENNLFGARRLLEQHRPKPGETDRRNFEWYYLERLFRGDQRVVKAYVGHCLSVAWTSDGKRVFTSGTIVPRQGSEPAWKTPCEVKLWDTATGRQLPLTLQGLTQEVVRIAISPDGKLLAAGRRDGLVQIWDVATGETKLLRGHRDGTYVSYLGFSRNGTRLVTAAFTYQDEPRTIEIKIWDASGKALATIDNLPRIYAAPGFNPDGTVVAAALNASGTVKAWDSATGKEAFACRYGDGQVVSCIYSPDGRYLAACGENDIRLWHAANHESAATWHASSTLCGMLSYSRDGKYLAVGGVDGSLEILDTATGHVARSLRGHNGDVQEMAFNSDGTRLASAGIDGTLRIWNVAERDRVTFPRFGSRFDELDLSPGGRLAVTAEGDDAIRLWDPETGEPVGVPMQHRRMIRACRLSADGKRAFAIDVGNTIACWDTVSGKQVFTVPLEAGCQQEIVTTDDAGRLFAHLGPGEVVQLRDGATGTELGALRGMTSRVHQVRLSPDGRRLVAADDTTTLRIWDVDTRQEIASAKLADVYINNLRFSPDGRRLVVLGAHTQFLFGDLRILDVESGREVAALKGHALMLVDAAFSRDGQRLASCGIDHTIRLWDLASGQELLKLTGHNGLVNAVEFDADGHRLMSTGADRTVRIWDATPLPE